MMIVFGFLTLRNVRRQRRRVNLIPTDNTSIRVGVIPSVNHLLASKQPTIGSNKHSISTEINRTTQKRDAQLITMLLVQVSGKEN
jgi:hypothetical protein